MGVNMADNALSAWHDEIFERLVPLPISSYVHQLKEYIRYTGMEKIVVLRNWQSLQAYRATVPLLAHRLYCELFCLNVEAALAVLCSQDTAPQTRLQETASC
jgi:hypothetical protein